MLVRRSAPRVVGVLLAGQLVGCAAPTPTVPPAVLPPTATVTALTIVGLPESFSYGQTAQLQAMATLENGAQKLAADVTWQSSNDAIVSVASSGLLQVVGFGQAEITAAVGNVRSAASTSIPLPARPVARLAVKIDDHGSTLALSGATGVTFDLSASTGVGLKYAFDFGDGTSASGQRIAEHVFARTYSLRDTVYTVRATVTDAANQSHTVQQDIQVMSSLVGNSAFWHDVKEPSDGVRLFLDFGHGYFSRQFASLSRKDETFSLSFVVGPRNDIRVVLSNGEVLEGPIVLKKGWQVDGEGPSMRLRFQGGEDHGETHEFWMEERY